MEIPRKYLVVGLCVAAAGGSAAIGEYANSVYRDDVAECVGSVALHDTAPKEAFKICEQEIGDNPASSFRDFTGLALFGGVMTALIMQAPRERRRDS